MPQYNYLKPTLVTEVLELPYFTNTDLEISKTNWGPESCKNNEPCCTWLYMVLFKVELKGLWMKSNIDYYSDMMSFVCNLNVLHG